MTSKAKQSFKDNMNVYKKKPTQCDSKYLGLFGEETDGVETDPNKKKTKKKSKQWEALMNELDELTKETIEARLEEVNVLIDWSEKWLKDKVPRMDWISVLDPLVYGSEERNIMALLYIKCTNGVSDASVVEYFRELIMMKKKQYPNSPMVTLDICDHLEELAAVLWPTSKGTKNTVACANILRYIRDECGGVFPEDMTTWVKFHEIGPKSAALIIYCIIKESVDCPVDRWVFKYCKKLGYCISANHPDAMSFLLAHWLHDNLGIPFNNALGSVGHISWLTNLVEFVFVIISLRYYVSWLQTF